MGQKVQTLFKKAQEKGNHILNITTDNTVNSDGIYMIRMIVNDELQTKRTTILN